MSSKQNQIKTYKIDELPKLRDLKDYTFSNDTIQSVRQLMLFCKNHASDAVLIIDPSYPYPIFYMFYLDAGVKLELRIGDDLPGGADFFLSWKLLEECGLSLDMFEARDGDPFNAYHKSICMCSVLGEAYRRDWRKKKGETLTTQP